MKKNIITTLILTASLIIFGFFVFTETSEAQKKEIVLPLLIDIPAPPPVNPYFQVSSDIRRPDAFFSLDNPPPDEAPIRDLLDYWGHHNNRNPVYNYTLAPSDTVARRILAEIDQNPKLLPNYLNALADKPGFTDEVRRIYERELKLENIYNYRKDQIKNWLEYNSTYAVENLERAASQVRDTREYVTNQNEILSLAKVDFERAKPILERLINSTDQPASKTLAHWAFYMHAIREEDSFEADRHRKALMEVVEDKTAKPGIRDLAFDALVYGGDFPGRDEWYFSLLEDETLAELRVNGRLYTGLTTLVMREPPDKYVDKMVELVRSKNQTVRNAAARNLGFLLTHKNPKVVEALLPWLEDPNWAKEYSNERRSLIIALQQVRLPESVPGLIEVLNEKDVQKVRKGSYDVDDIAEAANYAVPPPPPPISSDAKKSVDYYDMDTQAELVEVEFYPFRGAAVKALANQKDIRAAQALRQILSETPKDERGTVVGAILASGGFSVFEQLDALESIARKYENIGKEMIAGRKSAALLAESAARKARTAVESAKEQVKLIAESPSVMTGSIGIGAGVSRATNAPREIEPFDPAEIKPLLGDELRRLDEPDYELVKATANRIAYLESREPYVAVMLRTYLQNWEGAAVNAVLLDDLRTGRADVDTIIKLLSLRKELREKQTNEVINAKSSGDPIALAVVACISENQGEYFNIFKNGSTDAKIALLGCGRLIRAEFPVQTVAGFIDDPNSLLSFAALRYLESLDTAEARNIVYAKSPEKVPVIGARFYFGTERSSYTFDTDMLYDLFVSVNPLMDFKSYYFYSNNDGNFEQLEARLREDILENKELLGIYAYKNNFVRIYKDRAVFSWEEDTARYWERTLQEKEFDYLKQHLAENNVSDLPPFLGDCIGDCEPKQLTMIGREGGRRVFINSRRLPGFFEELENIFTEFRKPPAKLRYWLEKDIAGLEILFADDNLKAVNVWKNGDDLRLNVYDPKRREEIVKEVQKQIQSEMQGVRSEDGYKEAMLTYIRRYNERVSDSFYWLGSANGEFDKNNSVGQPSGFVFIAPEVKEDDYGLYMASFLNRGGIIASYSGLSIIRDGDAKILSEGWFDNEVNADDGKWAVALKRSRSEESDAIVLVNLQNDELTELKLEQYTYKIPTAHIPSLGGFLIRVGKASGNVKEAIEGIGYVVLNPETGDIREIRGELRPLMQQTYRKLQPKEKSSSLSWAAIPDQIEEKTVIGTYDAGNYKFKPLMTVPKILFDSMNMWVDESEKKVYVIYESQLISIPLKTAEEVSK